MFIILSFLILIVYAVMILCYVRGWMLLPSYTPINTEDERWSVAVIVPCKNVRGHLPALFDALKQQSTGHFHLLLVDDESDDGTREYISSVTMPQMCLLDNQGRGKKEALRTAIERTDASLIITLDADCVPAPRWVETIAAFHAETDADLIIAPVAMTTGGGWLQNFQQLDFTAMVACTGGAAAIGCPILCNGANLAFKREVWLACVDELRFDEPSGDDIFLLQSVKRRKGVIRFLRSEHAMVRTAPQPSIQAFLNQRRRWAGKKAAYRDPQLALTALTVFAAALTIVLHLVLALWCGVGAIGLAMELFVFKWAVDYTLLALTGRFFALRNVFVNTWINSLFHPFYIVAAALMALFRRKGW